MPLLSSNFGFQTLCLHYEFKYSTLNTIQLVWWRLPSKIFLVSHIWVNLNGFLRAYNCLPIFPGPGMSLVRETTKRLRVPLLILQWLLSPSTDFHFYRKTFNLTTDTWGTLTKPVTVWQLVFLGRNEKQTITNWLNIRTKVGFNHSLKICCKDCTGQLNKWEKKWCSDHALKKIFSQK